MATPDDVLEWEEWKRITANSMRRAASDLEETIKWAPDDLCEEDLLEWRDWAAAIFQVADDLNPDVSTPAYEGNVIKGPWRG